MVMVVMEVMKVMVTERDKIDRDKDFLQPSRGHQRTSDGPERAYGGETGRLLLRASAVFSSRVVRVNVCRC
jgi:hypothetical protein